MSTSFAGGLRLPFLLVLTAFADTYLFIWLRGLHGALLIFASRAENRRSCNQISWMACTSHFWYLLLVQLSRDLCSNFRVRVARHVDTICFPCRCRRSKVAELLRGFEMSQNSELQYCAVACVTPLLNHVRSGVDRLGKIDLSPAIYGLLTG